MGEKKEEEEEEAGWAGPFCSHLSMLLSVFSLERRLEGGGKVVDDGLRPNYSM